MSLARVLSAVLLCGLLGSTAAAQQTDQDPAQPTVQKVRSPKGALRRAMVIPGWGQIYNRQFLKLPILYAGMGVFLASAIQGNTDYLLYRRAFQYKAHQERVDAGLATENPALGFQAEYEQIVAEFGPISSNPLETRRDNFRRNRDLSILGIGAFWALGVLDAYVTAHLSDFDVGEDLTMRIEPHLAGVAALAGTPSDSNLASRLLPAPGVRVLLLW
ncbi:MAG: hypothetical protein ACI80V_001409 [Rhodothermales bacterium]